MIEKFIKNKKKIATFCITATQLHTLSYSQIKIEGTFGFQEGYPFHVWKINEHQLSSCHFSNRPNIESEEEEKKKDKPSRKVTAFRSFPPKTTTTLEISEAKPSKGCPKKSITSNSQKQQQK